MNQYFWDTFLIRKSFWQKSQLFSAKVSPGSVLLWLIKKWASTAYLSWDKVSERGCVFDVRPWEFFFSGSAGCSEGVVGGGRGASLDHLQQTRRSVSQSRGLASQLPIPFHGVPKIAVRHVVGGAWQACRLRYFCHPSTTKTIAHSTCSFCTSCLLSLAHCLDLYHTRRCTDRESDETDALVKAVHFAPLRSWVIILRVPFVAIQNLWARELLVSGPECMWHSSSGFCFCSTLS